MRGKADPDQQLLSFDRRRQILEAVNRKKSVTVDALCEAFPVSRMTISRDLERLEREGLLQRVHGGAVSLAQRTGCPIVPIACSARSRKVLKSWDGFIIPFPFTTLIVVHGDPIQVERNCDEAGLEAKRKEAEEALRTATVQADRFALQQPDL